MAGDEALMRVAWATGSGEEEAIKSEPIISFLAMGTASVTWAVGDSILAGDTESMSGGVGEKGGVRSGTGSLGELAIMELMRRGVLLSRVSSGSMDVSWIGSVASEMGCSLA